jgi:cellulose synthase/poly-beta-1,6-N-acetylglucosamine synthase-like glycosyltransferase
MRIRAGVLRPGKSIDDLQRILTSPQLAMSPLEVCFWLSAGVVIYAYGGYPLLLTVLARLRPRPVLPKAPVSGSVSIVLAAHNEVAHIDRRIQEFTRLLESTRLPGEVIVISDGSTDATAAIARSCAGPVRVLELPVRQGKAVALTAGCRLAVNELLVFADARQRWAPDALPRLLENFADPSVGAVSGDLVVEAAPGVMNGVSLYWRYEKWLRKTESRVYSMVSVTGAICAVRRELFRPIPGGTMLDDMYWPLQVALQGYRVVHEPRAVALDRLPERARDEFRRKVRTLSGNFQLVARMPIALVPWRNPVWFQLVSHKLLRLLVPWLLLLLLGLSAVLPGAVYRTAFWLQTAAYLVGLAGIWRPVGSRLRLASAAGSLLVLNAAAWHGFWVWLAGRADRSWAKVAYAPGLPSESPQTAIPGTRFSAALVAKGSPEQAGLPVP